MEKTCVFSRNESENEFILCDSYFEWLFNNMGAVGYISGKYLVLIFIVVVTMGR